MRRKTIVAALVAATLRTSAAHADLCTIEATPAATLLLPYFEVDIADPNGVDTFFSINNASAGAVLTHVIVWADWSVEALDFNVYLTGYDVQTIGMGLMIRDGVLPPTANDSSVSPLGEYSDGHGGPYPGCAGVLPYVNPALDPDFLAHLQAILTGQPTPLYGGLCGGADFGDGLARGYVTVDVTRDCTLLTPCENGYFHDGSGVPGTGVAGYDNVLFGDWYRIDYANDFAEGDDLVHIEAAPLSPNGMGGGLARGSFWNRCTAPFGGAPFADLREPLGTTFASRFYQNAAFTGGTDFVVWKDSQEPSADGYDCGDGPAWAPLPESQVIFFDEEENPEAICSISPCPQEDVVFPYETNRVSVADIEVTPESGWVYLNLNQNFDGPFAYLAQAWAESVHSAEGRFSAGLAAIQLDSYCDAQSILIGPPEDFPASQPLCNYFTGEGCPDGATAGGGKGWD